MSKELTRYARYGLLIFFTWLVMKAMLYFERQSPDANMEDFGDVLWYTIVTLTTVGYGDFYPVTTGGKILGLTMILGSLGVLSFLIGRVSIIISNYRERIKMGLNGTDFKGHFVIIGWDEFSKMVVSKIIKSGNKVAILTNNKNELDLIHETFPKEQCFVLFNDYGNYEGLKIMNIAECSKVFINFPEDSQSLIHVINMKKIYKDLDFVIILNSPDLKETFESVGVTYMVSKNEIASKLVASYIQEPDVASLTEDLMETSVNEDDHDILQYYIAKNNPYNGKEYTEVFMSLKKNYNGVLLGVSKNGVLHKNPSMTCQIDAGDYIIVISNGVDKQKIEKDFGVSDGRILLGIEDDY